jgi:hypothetical protein
MSKQFITFGAGEKNYIDAGKRLLRQANNLNLFDKTILYTDEFLKKDTEFWSKHKAFIENNKRGYGYWLWKSFIIKKTIEKMQDNDILLYLDSGCEIDIREKDFLIDCFNIVENDLIISFKVNCLEKNYNKMDLLLKLNMNNNKYLNTNQHPAGVLLILICEKTRNLINEWYELSCNYHLIDDTNSINKNLNCFIEHRHDQSIFSLLTKKYNICSKIDIGTKCIKIIRSKTSVSQINNINNIKYFNMNKSRMIKLLCVNKFMKINGFR